MEFPYRESFGEVDPDLIKEHFSRSVTPEEFIEHAKGKTLEELQFEQGPDKPFTLIGRIESENGTGVGPIISEQGKGPRGFNRYVKDPTAPGSVIDMRQTCWAYRLSTELKMVAGGKVECFETN